MSHMRTKEIKSLLLKKGWAGKTISREETIARLNPLMAQHVALGRLYDLADVTPLRDKELVAQLDAIRKRARTDMGKVAETIFSCGGVAHSGADRSDMPSAGDDLRARLMEAERAVSQSLLDEKGIEHQMRTEAVLQRLRDSNEERMSFLLRWSRLRGSDR